jgi:2'-5' RNA ligase
MTETAYKGCIVLNCDFPHIKDVQSIIHPDHIHDSGLENTPHITLIYGINETEDLEKIKKFCAQVKPMELYTSNIDVFSNDEFDVLKYNVIPSNDLLAYRRRCLSFFDNVQTYEGYNPHLTIGYLAHGAGKNYTMKFAPMPIKITSIVYSVSHETKFELNF